MALAADPLSPRVGIEICSSTLNAVVLKADGSIGASRELPLEPNKPVVEQLAPLMDELRTEAQFTRIGVAVPGLVDTANRRVAYSANMPENVSVDLVNEINYTTGLDVYIENDANAAAYGEFVLGAGRGSRDMFYATLGEGVGGAFIFAGELWRGAAGFAGEFGYVPINSEGIKLEEVASAPNIVRRTKERFYQDSTSSLNSLPNHTITLEAIIAAAENNDDFAQLMLHRTGSYVGTAIASVINLLNIERIVVGGAIMRAKDVVLAAIAERSREITFGPSFASTTILAGELGRNAAAIGVACLADRGL
ncbi:MAG TPA: ROK family protein [Pyrinomonadaceae bacterium]|nr:ROK family protein [Pyrinomonadaceae bacterium]